MCGLIEFLPARPLVLRPTFFAATDPAGVPRPRARGRVPTPRSTRVCYSARLVEQPEVGFRGLRDGVQLVSARERGAR